MKNTMLCRSNLHDRLGIEERSDRSDIQVFGEIQGMKRALDIVHQLAEPRLVMGGLRHGSKWDHKSLMDYMKGKFKKYEDTGNFEMLVDHVNFCAVEYQLRTHPRFHFIGEDRG